MKSPDDHPSEAAVDPNRIFVPVPSSQKKLKDSILEAQQPRCSMCSQVSFYLPICPCENARYCSIECQLAHWPEHAPTCNHGREFDLSETACANCRSESKRNMWCQCFTVQYCGAECQRLHWNTEHHKVCRPLYTHENAVAARRKSAERSKLKNGIKTAADQFVWLVNAVMTGLRGAGESAIGAAPEDAVPATSGGATTIQTAGD